jgi:hypothetical protein
VSQRDGTPVLVTKEGAVALTKVELGTKGDNGGIYESFLQELLYEHPEVLPLEQIEQAFETLVPVCREFPTKHGLVDNLFITPEGNIVIVEAKLWRNPESRRRVVAQALDYASCIFEMSYSDFEAAALRGEFGGRPKPSSLWTLIPEAARLPEQEFVDAVSGNLRSGRIVVLVVGDGIRSETERLMESLQSHAGFRFTFALIELSIFNLPGTGQRLVVPRTLVRTQLIERGVVRIEGNGIAVTAVSPCASEVSTAKPVPGSISAEEFFEVMRVRHPALPYQLKAFLDLLSPLGVYPEFRRALNLKWAAPSGKTANLGIIQRDGQVWTNESGFVLGDRFAREYNEALASAWDGSAHESPWGASTKWQVRIGGKVPRIESVAEQLDEWVAALRRLLPLAAERIAASE